METARRILEEKGYTCVLRKGDVTHITTERGVKPLVRWLTEELDAQGFSAADKVVGRATAYLYALLGVKEVWAQVMSVSAAEVLTRYGIAAVQETLVENIINRQGTGICPFEAAVLDIHTPAEALLAIREKMEEMGIRL
jgi:hypothetical protein